MLPLMAKAQVWQESIKPTLIKATDSRGLTILFSGIAAASLLKGSDPAHLKSIQNNINLSQDLNDAGDFLGTGIPGVAIAVSQYYFFEHHSEALSHLATITYTGVSTALLKAAINRDRPNGGGHSMPSGHTSTAFATATALTYEYGWKAASIAYPIALLVALQRLDANAHWPSDILMGATIGVFWARAVHENQHSNITPVALSDGGGLIWQKQF